MSVSNRAYCVDTSLAHCRCESSPSCLAYQAGMRSALLVPNLVNKPGNTTQYGAEPSRPDLHGCIVHSCWSLRWAQTCEERLGAVRGRTDQSPPGASSRRLHHAAVPSGYVGISVEPISALALHRRVAPEAETSRWLGKILWYHHCISSGNITVFHKVNQAVKIYKFEVLCKLFELD